MDRYEEAARAFSLIDGRNYWEKTPDWVISRLAELFRWHDDIAWGIWFEQPHYKATDPTPELEIGTGDPGVKWSPSIHMPRWASRITLEIVNVRVERVQEISEEDAKAEGVDWYSIENKIEGIGRCQQAFKKLWDSINAKRGFGWGANPWVWVIEFKRV